MKKINLYLTDLQHRELKDKAHHDDISMSELVREAIDEYLTPKSKRTDGDLFSDPLFDIIGAVESAEKDLSENHDKYLYDDPYD